MKKIYLLLTVALLALPFSLRAQTVIFSESFENGIPETWTQEFLEGHTPWQVEELADYQYPSGAITLKQREGTHRLYLRNTTGTTQKYKTLIITPPHKCCSFWFA